MSIIIGNTLVILSTAIALAFMITYHFKAYWWRSSDGRHVFAFMGVITAVLLLSSGRIVLGNPSWYVWLRVAVFAGIPIVLAWHLVILLGAQSRRKIRTKGGDHQ